jgi:hypothetical protein
MVPNDFTVELSTHDYERLSPYAEQLGEELAGMVREYAKQQHYTFNGPVSVHLEKAEDLGTGLYRVRSRAVAAATPGGGAAAGPPPSTPPNAGTQGGGYGYPRQVEEPRPAAGGGVSWGAKPSAPPAGSPSAGLPAGVSRLPGTGPDGPNHWLEINGVRHQLTTPVLVLGRSTEADLRIDDPGVSRRHCEIRVGSPSMVLDMGSTNGIVVDGQHTRRATLRDGSRIVMGSTTIVYRQAEG